MATTPRQAAPKKVEYPSSDGKPMAETEIHRDNMIDLIEALRPTSRRCRTPMYRVIC